jgi:hypothetical protein
MADVMEYLEVGGGMITSGILTGKQEHISGYAKLLRASKAELVPIKDGSKYVVYKFRDIRYRRILHDLIKKDMPVYGGFFWKKTFSALCEILSKKQVSTDNMAQLQKWFPALDELLFPYEFEGSNPFQLPRLEGLQEVLQQLVKQYRKYATAADGSTLNEWQPLSGEEKDRYQEEQLKRGIINPNVLGSRKLHSYPNRSMRSSLPTDAVDDGVDDDCGKDYGSKRHSDLTNGTVIICCVHGFVLSKTFPSEM